MELSQGGRVDRGENRRGGGANQEAEGLREYLKKLGHTARRSQGPTTKRLMRGSKRLSKKAPDEGDEAQGGPPDGEGGAVARGRAPPGPQAEILRKVCAPPWEKGRGLYGPPALAVDLHLYAFARPRTGEAFWLIPSPP